LIKSTARKNVVPTAKSYVQNIKFSKFHPDKSANRLYLNDKNVFLFLSSSARQFLNWLSESYPDDFSVTHSQRWIIKTKLKHNQSIFLTDWCCDCLKHQTCDHKIKNRSAREEYFLFLKLWFTLGKQRVEIHRSGFPKSLSAFDNFDPPVVPLRGRRHSDFLSSRAPRFPLARTTEFKLLAAGVLIFVRRFIGRRSLRVVVFVYLVFAV